MLTIYYDTFLFLDYMSYFTFFLHVTMVVLSWAFERFHFPVPLSTISANTGVYVRPQSVSPFQRCPCLAPRLSRLPLSDTVSTYITGAVACSFPLLLRKPIQLSGVVTL